MKRIELTQAWFSQCPRYLSAKRFGQATGLLNQEKNIESLMNQGLLPSKRVGRHLMVDMHELMLMMPSDSPEDEICD